MSSGDGGVQVAVVWPMLSGNHICYVNSVTVASFGRWRDETDDQQAHISSHTQTHANIRTRKHNSCETREVSRSKRRSIEVLEHRWTPRLQCLRDAFPFWSLLQPSRPAAPISCLP
ncbi:hypothetical protein GWK47_026683 [Chionoecetes opilio]|uniref:Uncharacterized protein n=1 Tax=Chionoecetes opilio TaxID=41210 RepID=A0A8J8WNH6_CHIOP|nr:hypothetical protein GWK47_026683 [Chionoecetes opilio]